MKWVKKECLLILAIFVLVVKSLCLCLFQTFSQSGLLSVFFHLSHGVALSDYCLYSAKAIYVQWRTLQLICQPSSPGPFYNFSIPLIVPSLHL